MSRQEQSGLTEIAVTGYACRLPKSSSPAEFWSLLSRGQCAIGAITPDRWNASRFTHPDRKKLGMAYTDAAGLVEDLWDFDPGFFGISRREALQMDPQQRILLMTAWEAIEAASLDNSTLAEDRTGVFVGASSLDHTFGFCQDLSSIDAQFMTGNTVSILANRISYAFDLKGPSYAVDTACSSSFYALHQAVKSLRSGEIDTAVVGGVSVLLSPYPYVGFSRASMLSQQGLCRAFDTGADGYVRAEGAVVFVLRRLEDATAAGDPVRSVILHTGVNSDGRTIGLSMPSGEDQARLLTSVYGDLGLGADDLAFIEAHGTGTPVGDPIEAYAIGKALGRDRRSPLPIGSVKSNIGHLEPGSGVAGLLKAQLSLEHGLFPATLHVDQVNENIPVEEWGLSIATEPVQLVERLDGRPWIAGVNSFGFGGANAHAVLRQATAVERTRPRAHSAGDAPPPLVLTAAGRASLQASAAVWRDMLADRSRTEAQRMISTAAHRRTWHAARAVICAESQDDLVDALEDLATDSTNEATAVCDHAERDGKTAFVFAGNGSQWAGMGADLYANDAAYRAAFDDVAAEFQRQSGLDLVEIAGSDDLEERLNDSEVAQPFLFALQVALVQALASQGLRPDAVAGHSVGEVAAAWASGAVDLADAVHLIVARSKAVQPLRGRGGMAAVLTGVDAVEQAIAEFGLPGLTVAGDNSPRSVSLSGEGEDLARFAKLARKKRLAAKLLDVTYPYHSPAMEEVREALLAAVGDLRPRATSTTLVSSTTGAVVDGQDLTAEFWWQNARQSVQFRTAVEALADLGCKVFVEIGPRPVLQSYVTDTMRGLGRAAAVTTTLDGPGKHQACAQRIAARAVAHGANVDGAAFFGPDTGAAHEMPAYQWSVSTFRRKPSAEAMDFFGSTPDHPLLGWRVRAKDHSWEAMVDTDRLPWLADHIVDGAAVLPAAGYAEAALAAAAQVFDDHAIELTDFDILQPLALEQGQSARLRTVVEAETGIVRIESRPYLAEQDWVLHARGTVARAPHGAAAAVPERTSALLAVEWSGNRLYHLLGEAGLSYGPSLRRVERLRAGAGRALADLSEPEDAGDFYLHPAALDAAMHGIFPLIAGQRREQGITGGETYLPVRLGRLVLFERHKAPAKAEITLVRLSEFGAEATVQLLDADENLVGWLEGLRLKRVRLQRARRQDAVVWAQHAVRLMPVDGTAHLPDAWQAPADRLRGLGCAAEIPPEPDSGALLADAACRRIIWNIIDGLGGGSVTRAAAKVHRSALPLYHRMLEALQQDGALVDTAGAPCAEPAEAERLVPEGDCPYPELGIALDALIAEAPERTGDLSALMRLSVTLPDTLTKGLTEGLPARLRPDHSPTRRAVWAALERATTDLAEQWDADRRLDVLVIGDAPPALMRKLLALAPVGRVTLTDPDDRVVDLLARGLAADVRVKAADWTTALAAGPFDVAISGDRLMLLGDDRIGRLAGALAPGGCLVGVEAEPNLLTDMVAGQSPAWWAGSVEPEFPVPLARHGVDWEAALTDAGLNVFATAALDSPALDASILVGTRATVAAAKPAKDAADRSILVLHDAAAAAQNDAAALASGLAAQGAETAIAPLPDDGATWSPPSSAAEIVICPPATRKGVTGRLGRSHREMTRRISMLRRLLTRDTRPARIWILTRGGRPASANGHERHEHRPTDAAIWGLSRVLTNEHPDTEFRLIDLDPAMPAEAAALRVADLVVEAGDERELMLDAAGMTAPRVQALPELLLAGDAAAKAPMGRRLTQSREGALDSLRWEPVQRRAPESGEVEIEVGATGLNFRDVMWAQRLLPAEALEDGFAGPTLGMECAGTIVRASADSGFSVGQRVVAFAPGAFASHVTLPAAVVAPLPDSASFEMGAALPAIFLTAHYALTELARLRDGESVLIHGAAGGVGLAALQIAKARGARVFATAGRPEKRALLEWLGAEHVFDSRSLAFADELRAVNDGEGVDVVLNSLAGEAMARSIGCLRPFGRFIELGKQDFYANSRVGLRPFRQNLSYFGVDADQLIGARPDLARRMFTELVEEFAAGRLTAPPLQIFEADEAVAAFRLMQRSDHLGKIVIRPPKIPAAQPAVDRAIGNGTWLIVGGLGGFGLATARWLARQGVGRLWLTSRSGVVQHGAEAELAEIRAAGAKVETCAVDACDREAMEVLVARIEAEGRPLEGVIHAAMVLDDAMFAELDLRRIEDVMRPKLEGAQLLDQLTRRLQPKHFILYSSVTTLFGNPGQAPYVAANMALESLAAQRRAAGLPGLAIAWGPIKDCGYLAREDDTREFLARRLDNSLLTADEALAGLGTCLATPDCPAAIAFAPMPWGKLAGDLALLQTPLFELIDREADAAAGTPRELLAELDTLDDAAALRHIVERLVAETARILRQPESELDPYRPLTELGFDSLMAVDLKMSAEEHLGISLPLMALGDQVTVADLAQKVLARIRSSDTTDDESQDKGEIAVIISQHVNVAGLDIREGAVDEIAERIHKAGQGGS